MGREYLESRCYFRRKLVTKQGLGFLFSDVGVQFGVWHERGRKIILMLEIHSCLA